MPVLKLAALWPFVKRIVHSEQVDTPPTHMVFFLPPYSLFASSFFMLMGYSRKNNQCNH